MALLLAQVTDPRERTVNRRVGAVGLIVPDFTTAKALPSEATTTLLGLRAIASKVPFRATATDASDIAHHNDRKAQGRRTHLRQPPSCASSSAKACLDVFCSEMPPVQPSPPASPSQPPPPPPGAAAPSGFQPAPSFTGIEASAEITRVSKQSGTHQTAPHSMSPSPSCPDAKVIV